MKIVLNSDGDIIGRHESGALVTPAMYEGFGKVLIGDVDPNEVDLTYDEPKLKTNVIDVTSRFAHETIMANFEKSLGDINTLYPQSERSSWSVKLFEAWKILDDPSSKEIIYLRDISELTGEKIETIADKIIKKARDHSILLAQAESQKKKLTQLVNGARSVKSIMDVVCGLV